MELLPKKYSLNEINEISFTGFECILKNDILSLIEELTNKVSSPSYIKTPIFNKRIKKIPNDIGFIKKNDEKINQKKKIKMNEILNDDDWDLLSSFEVTKIDKKQGIDTEIVHIRSLLNMLTESNFNLKH
jgi:succinate dehydrogenase flavin-adding protein (antitoxin of CptAB toxin-antitoxin module)